MASMLGELESLLAKCHSQDDDERNAAERRITSSFADPDFAQALVLLAASASHSEAARLDASVHLSRLLRRHWPSPDSDDSDCLQPIDRAIIKRRLCNVFINAPPRVQAQLAEALGAAAASDPGNWNPPVLPAILSCLDNAVKNQDFAASNAQLAALSSFFSRAVHLDPGSPLQGFVNSHIKLFKDVCNHIGNNRTTRSGLRPMFEFVRLCCEIFYWLKSKHSSDYCKDNLHEWMTEFHSFLTTVYHQDVEADGAPDALRATVIRILILYVEKFEEELCPFMKEFLLAVFDLSTARTTSGRQLLVAVLRFFTTVAESTQHVVLQNTVKDLFDSCIMPNLWPHDEDEELFKMNPIQFVKRDSESNAVATHFFAAWRLLQGLAVNYKEQVAALVSKCLQQMSAGGAKSWKDKYSGIYLLIALKPNDGTPMIDMDQFFKSVIFPEFDPDQKSEPMLKAAVLRFLKEFLDQFPKDTVLPLLPNISKFVLHDSKVVHSYAATIIEKLLTIKDVVQVPGVNTVTMSQRYIAADIQLYAPEIIQNLFRALSFPDSPHNPFLMSCLMRVLATAKITGPVMHDTVSGLVGILTKILDDQMDFDFSYYLFESLAAVTSQADGHDQRLQNIFGTSLDPILWKIMENGFLELQPYAIQIFSQLVSFHQNIDKEIFGILVSDAAWDQPPLVPAMVGLLRALFLKFPHDLQKEGMLNQLMYVFHQRLRHNSSEDSAIKIINTLVETVSESIMRPFMQSIWSVLFNRACSRKAVEYLNSVGLLMALVLERYGLPFLVQSTRIKSSNHMFECFINVYWAPNLKFVTGALKVKQAAVFSTKLLCGYEGLSADVATWGKLLDATVTLLSHQDGAAEEQDDGAGLLQCLRPSGYDLLRYVDCPKAYLVRSLAVFSARYPGSVPPVIHNHVNPVNISVLRQLCADHQVSIV